ncbi:MAG TPA: ATP-dependent DNA helicase UvrD2 [Acidimicrobiales bacterium]|nr:ATP-dependent DNA helicase UvrD2 [Acidimicrobiales bacterium]
MALLEGLDPAQLRAVVSEAQPLCVLAPAGSGKTRVLTRRIAHRVATGQADAARVLTLTFTRKAAGELRGRLGSLGVREPIAAGTFHAVAYAQLRRRWADRGERPPVLLERKARLLAPLLPRARTGAAARATVQPGDLAAEIEWAKARLVPPSRYEAEVEAAGRRPPVPPATMAVLYERYENEKRRKGLVDFDDLLMLCALALEQDREFAAAQRWRFRHLFVDEFQDVNPVQFRLLQGWLGDRSDLCVVGDPDQAIYSWNGADPTLLTGFERRFPGAEVVRLDRNYRSTAQIVAVGRAVLGGGGGDGGHDVTAVRGDGALPAVRPYDTDADEARGVARALRRAHRPGVPWSHLAVLARTNAQLVLFEERLRAAGIPCRLGGGALLLRLPEVQAALEHLRSLPPTTPFVSRLADVEAAAAEGGAEERRANLEAVVRMGHDYAAVDAAATVDGFVAWLAAGDRGDGADGGRPTDAVELATFHRAKGLEWPVVFVTGLEKGLVPIGHATTPAAESEERRLLHVALTRAVDEVHVSWAERRTFGSSSVARSPSPLLGAIEDAVAAMAAGGTPGEWRERLAAERARLRALPGPGPGRHRPGAGADPAVWEALTTWRAQAAQASGVPAHVIFHDATLAAVAEARPRNRAELLALPGLGPVKAQRYGDTLLAVLAACGS